MDKQIQELDDEVRERMHPFVKELELLNTMPGINMRTAEDIIAETGVDMNQFPTSAHFAAWAGICPGSSESAGKKNRVAAGWEIKTCVAHCTEQPLQRPAKKIVIFPPSITGLLPEFARVFGVVVTSVPGTEVTNFGGGGGAGGEQAAVPQRRR